MIKATIGRKKVNIPISWDEIGYSKAVELYSIDGIDQKVLHCIGINQKTLNSLSISSSDKLFTILSFLEDAAIYNKIDEESYKDFDFGSKSYEDVEKTKLLLSDKEKNGFQVMPDVIKLITGDDVTDLPASKALGIVNFFLLKSIHFFSITRNSENMNTMRKKFKQELTGSKDSEHLALS